MNREALKFKNSVFFVVSFTILLWVVKALEWAVELDFGFLGILPRTLSGTMGIFTAPLIHGDVLHLISNTFPLLLLGVSVFYFYDRIALEVFAWIYFMSGFWVWMAARDAYHIGASGLVYGLVAFLFFSGIFRRDTKSLSISLVVIFLYGGMLQGLFPTNGRISWESHLLGALAGAFCAFFYRDVKLQIHQKTDAYYPEQETEPVVQASSLLPINALGKKPAEKGVERSSEDAEEEVLKSYTYYQQAIDSYPLSEKTYNPGSYSRPLPKQTDGHQPEKTHKTDKGNSDSAGRKFVYVFSSPSDKKQPKSLYYYTGPKGIYYWKRTPTAS